MQRKSLFKTILIVFLLCWSVYALWPTYKLNTLTPEKRKSLDDEGKLIPLIDKSIRLGLDLQGGMYLTYELDLPVLIEQLARVKDSQLSEILSETRQELNVSTEDFMTLLMNNLAKRKIPLNQYWGDYGDSEKEVKEYLDKEAKDAMNRSLEILRNRIDQFGVSEPVIQKVGARRILIELPGISDPDQAKALIGKTAMLEFKMLKDPLVFSDVINKIDKALAKERGSILPEEDEETEAGKDTSKEATKQQPSQDKAISVNELFGEEEAVEEEQEKTDTSLVVDENVFKENPFLALLRDLRQHGKEVSVPVENIKAVDRILEREDVQKLIPPDAEFRWSSETINVGDREYRELFFVKKEAELTGKYLTDAKVTISQDVQSAGLPEVDFKLDRQGTRIFSRVTGANIEKRLAIILDDRVYMAPRIQSKIPNGSGRITGMKDMDEAKMIAIVLRAGALPAPVEIIQEKTVGPSLGQDSIKKGMWSALIGLAIVVSFMALYYRMAGMIADMALIFNFVFLMAVLAQFRFTLTMPGIAGIVLTIGMAVDANVLIYERIREELKTGKTVRAAIDTGYARAFVTIFDSNLTTVISAVVLYQFGVGAIRGFAVTLIIGLVVSMFTSIVMTRYVFDAMTTRRTLTKLSI
jgi:SecD/SecF fusion protein